jgi:fructose-1,6-bisphosphatase
MASTKLMASTMPTLAEHLAARPGADSANLARVIEALAEAGREIARELARAALVGRLGTTGATNVQGEAVKKLDIWANDVVVRALTGTGLVCTMVSEEMEEPLHLDDQCPGAPYVVCFDPVDGSSNLDVNGVVGTIFGIRPRTGRTPGRQHVAADAVAAATAQVAAGYIAYGPSTLLALTTGQGADIFTLDPNRGAFIQSHPSVRIPARGHTYSVNEANSPRWHLRQPPASLLRDRAVERAGRDPQGAAVWPHRQRGQPRRGRQGVLLLPRFHAHPLLHEGPVQVPAVRLSL